MGVEFRGGGWAQVGAGGRRGLSQQEEQAQQDHSLVQITPIGGVASLPQKEQDEPQEEQLLQPQGQKSTGEDGVLWG